VKPSRDTPAGRAYNDLRNLARHDDRDPVEYFTLYALEGFLSRLAASAFEKDFVLKGGVLMAAFAPRRPTRDIDLNAAGFANDVESVTDRVAAIAAIEAEDGLAFDASSLSGALIRDEADYSGVRAKLTAQLASARIALHIDVNFGDPVWPAPAEIDLPRLLGGTLRLRGYPDHMVLAEKIVTAIDRGGQNTRWRDFVDIAAIIDTRAIRQSDLTNAITTVATYRKVRLRLLADVLGGMADLAQSRWTIWRRRQRLEASTPGQFADLLERVIAFVDPVLEGTASGTWSPRTQGWTAVPADSTRGADAPRTNGAR
jgi:hypothetical protein